MKKIFMFVLSAGILVSCNNNKKKDTGGLFNRDKDDYKNNVGDKTNGDNKSWSGVDVERFNLDCKSGFTGKGLTDNQVDQICSCSLDKFEKKYGSYDEANQKGNEDEAKEIGKECAQNISKTDNNTTNNGGAWSSADEQRFLDECEGSARQHVSADRAHEYCDCMLQKSKGKWSSYSEANLELTKMPKDELQGWVNDCNGTGE